MAAGWALAASGEASWGVVGVAVEATETVDLALERAAVEAPEACLMGEMGVSKVEVVRVEVGATA